MPLLYQGRFRGRVFVAIVNYLIRKALAVKGAAELDTAPGWLYRYALVLVRSARYHLFR